MAFLYLNDNQLRGVPTEFRTLDPSNVCALSGNPNFSCANVGVGTSCCNSFACGSTSTCYQG